MTYIPPLQYLHQDLQINDIYDCPKETLNELLHVHIHENDVIDKNGLEHRCGGILEMTSGDKTRTVCEDNASRIFQKVQGIRITINPELSLSISMHAVVLSMLQIKKFCQGTFRRYCLTFLPTNTTFPPNLSARISHLPRPPAHSDL